MSDATAPPTIVPGLPTVGRLPVLVTGGTGRLGRSVVAELVRSQVPARVLTRSTRADEPGVTYITGDLCDGSGLTRALDGVQAVINCATDPLHASDVDVDGTRRLAMAALDGDPPQVVQVSIVGCWDNPVSYYRAKAQAETVLVQSGLPHTIVRATQFHPMVAQFFGPQPGGISFAPKDFRAAPVDPEWVAKTLVDVALADEPVTGPVELAGPEVLSAREIAVLASHVRGVKLRRTVNVPPVGGVLKAFARGSNLPGPTARRGGITLAAWLTANR